MKDASRRPLLCSALLLPGFDFIAVRLPSLPPSLRPSCSFGFMKVKRITLICSAPIWSRRGSSGGELAFMLILDDDDDEKEEEANFRANSWSAPSPLPLLDESTRRNFGFLLFCQP